MKKIIKIFKNWLFNVRKKQAIKKAQQLANEQRRKFLVLNFKGKGKLPKELPAEAGMWKGLALTKKRNVTVHAHIPQRQFMGDSAELRVKVSKLINDSIQKIKDGIIALSAH